MIDFEHALVLFDLALTAVALTGMVILITLVITTLVGKKQ
jgi:hypothetical protein